MSGNINFNGWLNDDGSENYKCRAWVNFNGTGTVAIRAAGNVSSITDNGTGDYSVNFTTAMPDENFATVSTHQALTTAGYISHVNNGYYGSVYQTTTLVRVAGALGNDYGEVRDTAYVGIAIFR